MQGRTGESAGSAVACWVAPGRGVLAPRVREHCDEFLARRAVGALAARAALFGPCNALDYP